MQGQKVLNFVENEDDLSIQNRAKLKKQQAKLIRTTKIYKKGAGEAKKKTVNSIKVNSRNLAKLFI